MKLNLQTGNKYMVRGGKWSQNKKGRIQDMILHFPFDMLANIKLITILRVITLFLCNNGL